MPTSSAIPEHLWAYGNQMEQQTTTDQAALGLDTALDGLEQLVAVIGNVLGAAPSGGGLQNTLASIRTQATQLLQDVAAYYHFCQTTDNRVHQVGTGFAGSDQSSLRGLIDTMEGITNPHGSRITLSDATITEQMDPAWRQGNELGNQYLSDPNSNAINTRAQLATASPAVVQAFIDRVGMDKTLQLLDSMPDAGDPSITDSADIRQNRAFTSNVLEVIGDDPSLSVDFLAALSHEPADYLASLLSRTTAYAGAAPPDPIPINYSPTAIQALTAIYNNVTTPGGAASAAEIQTATGQGLRQAPSLLPISASPQGQLTYTPSAGTSGIDSSAFGALRAAVFGLVRSDVGIAALATVPVPPSQTDAPGDVSLQPGGNPAGLTQDQATALLNLSGVSSDGTYIPTAVAAYMAAKVPRSLQDGWSTFGLDAGNLLGETFRPSALANLAYATGTSDSGVIDDGASIVVAAVGLIPGVTEVAVGYAFVSTAFSIGLSHLLPGEGGAQKAADAQAESENAKEGHVLKALGAAYILTAAAKEGLFTGIWARGPGETDADWSRRLMKNLGNDTPPDPFPATILQGLQAFDLSVDEQLPH